MQCISLSVLTIHTTSFAALPNQGLSSSESTSNWLFERRAYTTSCVKLGRSDTESVEVDGMIDKYQKMLLSVWPKEWKSLVANVQGLSVLNISVLMV
ncbi:hypothetical protein V8B97DRAFT_1970070 [Scleroderma yunnanense]